VIEWPSGGEWIAFFLILVGGSFIAGCIDAWWEQRKLEKEREQRRGKRPVSGDYLND